MHTTAHCKVLPPRPYQADPGHLNGVAGEAEAAADVPAHAVAARQVRAVSGGETAYQAQRGGRAQPGCVGGDRGHVDGAGGGDGLAQPLGDRGAETEGGGRGEDGQPVHTDTLPSTYTCCLTLFKHSQI